MNNDRESDSWSRSLNLRPGRGGEAAVEKGLMLLPLQVSADGMRCLLRLSGLLLRACERQTLPTALQVGILRPGAVWGEPLWGQCGPSDVIQTSLHALPWWRGCGPWGGLFIRTLIPPHGLHSHDLITSQSLCLPTPSPLRVRVSTCNTSIETTASTYCFLFFSNIFRLRLVLVMACRTFNAP